MGYNRRKTEEMAELQRQFQEFMTPPPSKQAPKIKDIIHSEDKPSEPTSDASSITTDTEYKYNNSTTSEDSHSISSDEQVKLFERDI